MASPAQWVIAAAALSLISNRLGWMVPAVWVAGAGLASIDSFRNGQRLDRKLLLATIAVWAFWTLSFAMTGESWRTFASFEFQRRDGQIFFCLFPLLAVAAAKPSSRQVSWILGAFLAVQGFVALTASCFDLVGKRKLLTGLLFWVDEGPPVANYCGLYFAHNAVGSVQGLGCLVSATLAAFDPEDRRRKFWGILAIPLLWGVLLSRSRGSLIAMGLGLIVLAVLAVRQGRLKVKGLLLIGIVVVLTGSLFGVRLVHRLEELGVAGGTQTWRLDIWKRALGEWYDSPIVGEGLGRFNDLDREWSGIRHVYYVVTRATVVNNAFHAHNSYVHFLAEGGILGLGITVGFWGWIAWKLRGSREPFRVAAFLGVLYLFAISMTEHYMGGGALLLVLSSIVGAAWSLPEPSPTSSRVTSAGGSIPASASPAPSPSPR